MFIALTTNDSALQRSAMFFGTISLHSAPNGAEDKGVWVYKHVAPPEQEPFDYQ